MLLNPNLWQEKNTEAVVAMKRTSGIAPDLSPTSYWDVTLSFAHSHSSRADMPNIPDQKKRSYISNNSAREIPLCDFWLDNVIICRAQMIIGLARIVSKQHFFIICPKFNLASMYSMKFLILIFFMIMLVFIKFSFKEFFRQTASNI